MIPDNSRKKLEQLRQEAAFRAQLTQQYDKEMAAKYTRDMPSFTEWLDKRQQPKKMAEGGSTDDDYRSSHQAPGPHFGAPMHDVTREMYPKDFYSPNGLRYYADHTDPTDRDAYNKVTRVKGKPDEMVSIHRAIPTKVYKEALKKESPLKHMIRKGDWVAINKDYAKQHGEAVLLGDYKIASMRVPAKHVWTNADSIHEWGYHPDEVVKKATGGSVEPTQDEMRLALTKRHGLYSPLEKAAIEMPRNKGTGAEFMAELSKRPGYKAEEIADRAIPVPEGKMNKAEFLEHLKKHSLPPLEEKIKGASTSEDEDQVWNRVSQEMFGVNADDLSERQFREVESLISNEIQRTNPAAQYEKYQLPGGKNYREVLLTLPQRRPDASKYSDPAKYDADMRAFNAMGQEDFQSNHWRGHPNVLAHLRLSDRTGPNGEKLLHVEEVQSDWHQEGRDKGYQRSKAEIEAEQERINKEHRELQEKRTRDYSEEFKKVKQRMRELPFDSNSDEVNALKQRESEILQRLKAIAESEPAQAPKIQNNGVPDAPFKKSWHEMALKHALHHAAKRGYQGLLITPGSEQADRYKLSRHIDELHYNPDTHRLIASKGGNRLVDEYSVPPDQLTSHVGKEVAQKIMTQEPNVNGLRSLKGEQLQIGGEGMKGFYDKMIPTYLNKLGKPHGVQVGVMPIAINNGMHEPNPAGGWTTTPPETKQVHHFPITEPMRTSILKEGLPQYMRGGVVHKAEGGAVLPIEQMRNELMNKTRFKGLSQLQSIGAEEAPSLGVKAYVPPAGRPDNGQMPVGGIDTQQGDLPVGGIDMSKMQPGQQLMPTPAGQQQGMDQVPQGDKIGTMDGTGMPPTPNSNPNQMGSNILSMTPQGQAMAAMKPQGLKKGGNVSIDQMKAELSERSHPLCMTHDHGYADGGKVGKKSKSEPKNTVKAYKLFRVHPKHPGKLFPLFIGKNEPVEMGKWVDAEHIPTKGFAERPGWHAGDLPMATHIGAKSDPENMTKPDIRPDNQVWTEIEMPNDVDWQSEANRRGTNAKGKVVPVRAHITDQVPHGGHYRYKTNPNMTGNWLIGGAMKVNRVLDDAEVKKINKAAGAADLPRVKKQKVSDYGFATGGNVTKGYVKSTPKKPHPEVGKRFTATPQGNLVAPQVFDIMKHEGKGSIVPVPYDATTRDNRVTEVSGHQLTEPLVTEAGFDYAMDPMHVAQAIGGASNLGIAGRVQDRINQAAREHEGDVYLAPNTMSEKAENFSHHPAHIVLDLMKQRQLNKKTLKALSDDLRSQPEIHPTTKKKIFPYKNFVGFDHPNLGEQVMKGGHGLETTAGNLRKKMMDRLSLVNIQELLDYNLGDLKASILHPDIASDPKGYMGRTLVKAQAGAPLRLSRHKSYDTDYTGTYAGGFGNRPIETVMPDLYEEVEAELKQRPVKKAKTDTEYRNQVIGALEKRKERVAQPINARVINNAGLYEEGLKNGEFDPKNLESVLAYYKRKGGYKAGGKVKLHTDQDTMQLALSKKSKKAK